MVGENVRRSFSRRRSSRTVDYQSERSLLLSKAFHAMDTYGEGALTPEDLLHRLRLAMYAHPLYKDKDFSTSLNVRDFDADGDGMITNAEFVQGMDSSLFDENDPASESVPTWVQCLSDIHDRYPKFAPKPEVTTQAMAEVKALNKALAEHESQAAEMDRRQEQLRQQLTSAENEAVAVEQQLKSQAAERAQLETELKRELHVAQAQSAARAAEVAGGLAQMERERTAQQEHLPIIPMATVHQYRSSYRR